jgi:hypothetical protein
MTGLHEVLIETRLFELFNNLIPIEVEVATQREFDVPETLTPVGSHLNAPALDTTGILVGSLISKDTGVFARSINPDIIATLAKEV